MSVYVKAMDFTCTSNGLAYAMSLDPASTSCGSVPATQVRYLPLVAKGAAFCIPASGSNANRFDMMAAPGSIVGSLSIAVFSSTNGACTMQTATFTNIITLGACTPADGSPANGGTKAMQVWPAPSIMCAMRSMAGYDVIGPPTMTTCLPRCAPVSMLRSASTSSSNRHTLPTTTSSAPEAASFTSSRMSAANSSGCASRRPEIPT
jgi:hypothetical protein